MSKNLQNKLCVRRKLFEYGRNLSHRHRAKRINNVWSYDFLVDRSEDGRQVKRLAVIDEYTRDCLAIEVDRSFTTVDVIGVLRCLFTVRRTPGRLQSDNGPEFVPPLYLTLNWADGTCISVFGDVPINAGEKVRRAGRMILDAQFLCGSFVAFGSSQFWYIRLFGQLTLFCKSL